LSCALPSARGIKPKLDWIRDDKPVLASSESEYELVWHRSHSEEPAICTRLRQEPLGPVAHAFLVRQEQDVSRLDSTPNERRTRNAADCPRRLLILSVANRAQCRVSGSGSDVEALGTRTSSPQSKPPLFQQAKWTCDTDELQTRVGRITSYVD
jgi:hypothetical protein